MPHLVDRRTDGAMRKELLQMMHSVVAHTDGLRFPALENLLHGPPGIQPPLHRHGRMHQVQIHCTYIHIHIPSAHNEQIP